METLRKPFQGVKNIIRFNRHFYFIALGVVVGLIVLAPFFSNTLSYLFYGTAALIVLVTASSLAFSCYIYDFSGLYKLKWLASLKAEKGKTIVNIHAGFDETSELLKARFPICNMEVLDFYDPKKHTEVSIKRARKAYPPFPGTESTTTAALPLSDSEADFIFLIFAAHEIRDPQERVTFFKELKRSLAPNGKILVTEHLRDLPDFMAYTIGFFHFYPKSEWHYTFKAAGLKVSSEMKSTAFITTFILEPDGTST